MGFFVILCVFMYLYILNNCAITHHCTLAAASRAVLPWLFATCRVLWRGMLNCGENSKLEKDRGLEGA